jgi:hypothetical protein
MLVLAYAALLVLGAWPSERTPVLGPLSRFAWDTLARVSVRPGMAIFQHESESDRVLVAHCLRVVGRTAEGRETRLWSPTCPPRGTVFGTDYQDVVMQRATRAARVAPLLPEDGRLPRMTDPHVQRFVAIGDWFCRSPDAGAGRYDRVELTQQKLWRSYEDGRYLAGPPLVCAFDCGVTHRAPRPRCRLASGDDPAHALFPPVAP